MAFKGLFHQNSNYSASDFRQLVDGLYSTAGVVNKSTDFLKTVQSATVLRISAGKGVVQHSTSNSGKFYAYETANTDITITNPVGTAKRTLVYLEVIDSALLGSGSDLVQINQTSNTGTTPALPSTPANSIPLWDVSQASGGTLSTATITDVRSSALPPWRAPWGVVAYTSNATNSTPVSIATTTPFDVFGAGVMAPSFTAVANRLYRHTVRLPVNYNGGATVSLNLGIYTSANVARAGGPVGPMSGSGYTTLTCDYVTTETAGPVSFKLKWWSGQIVAGATIGYIGQTPTGGAGPIHYTIEDIGPA